MGCTQREWERLDGVEPLVVHVKCFAMSPDRHWLAISTSPIGIGVCFRYEGTWPQTLGTSAQYSATSVLDVYNFISNIGRS